MIRINLLGVAKPVARMVGPSEGVAPEAIILPGVFLVVLLLLSVVVFWYLSKDIDRLNKEFQRQKNEQARLAGIKEQNKRYELQKEQLELRQKTIQDLEASKVGPKELMTSLGDIVDRSKDLYLLSVKPKGEVAIGKFGVVLEGVSDSTDSIANFIAALQESGTFDDVVLKQTYEDDRGNRESYKFSVDCAYKQSSGESANAPAAQPAQGTGAVPRRAGL